MCALKIPIYELNNDNASFNNEGDSTTNMLWFRSDTGEFKMSNAGEIRTINLLRHGVFDFTFADFAVAGTSAQVALFTLPAGAELLSVTANCSQAWNGGATVTMSCGRNETPTELLIAQSVKSTGIKDTKGTKLTAGSGFFSQTVSTNIFIELVSTVSNLDQSTTGFLRVYVTWIQH